MPTAPQTRLQDDAFARRLDPASLAPIAVAFSGGPDSYLALQRTVVASARPVIALHVDHGLSPLSAAWAQTAQTLARDLGAQVRLLRWEGDKPDTGIPAAARAARHRLLADAARAVGAKVIVTGHTGDDALENAALGQGALYEWSPSPVWPQGRELMLLRPLLAERRGVIRARLEAQGILSRLVDDPANADPRHPRIAARASAGASIPPIPADPAPAPFEALPGGAIRIAFSSLTARTLAFAMTCAGGGERIPRRDQAERLLAARTGSLVGARLIDEGADALIVRNSGEVARGGLSPLCLGPHETGIFDGRYRVTAGDAGIEVRALKGRFACLDKNQRTRLSRLPISVRPGLAVVMSDNRLICPDLDQGQPGPAVRCLVAARLAAACGAIAHENAL